jgi:DNA repair exonuclease SbcCD ATPase subunit
MNNYIGEIITFLLTSFGGGVAWYWSKKKTRTEKTRENYTVVQDAINPLLDSIKTLTERNQELAIQLVDAHKLRVEYCNNVIELRGQVDEMTKKIAKLTEMVGALTKKNNDLMREIENLKPKESNEIK